MENQEIIKLLQESQKTARLNTIISIIAIILPTITSIILIWKSLRPEKPSPKIRLIRKDGEIEETKLFNKTRLQKLYLERQTIQKEMNYESDLNKMQSGTEDKVVADFLEDLKKEGENIISEGEKVKEKVEKLKDRVK
ncbi:MAG: hypothetical protein I3273_04925 [Candidatus Moeniiplasma glomeromycotorum]|nr:hypothetical protein [Candidatus Moeniiplasma glomeromycotorum]MCE8167885.1 hypothetical protein [Candidatus Moeniiplasma glomeromycotorum]MCE8169435.1 hypothetical protein [Candidatus Moeniiplasma glomeromycotorum]